MERMTVRTPAGVANLDYPQNTYYQDGTKDQIATSALRQQAIERLAAYEDICFDEDGKERITIDELSALVKAQDERRVVVLPVKTVFEPVWDAGETCDLRCPKRFDGLDTCQGCPKAVPYAHQREYRTEDIIGKTVFLTCAETEAALSDKEGDDHEADPA